MGVGEWVGGNIIPRIRLTSAKDLVEVEAELGKNGSKNNLHLKCSVRDNLFQKHYWGKKNYVKKFEIQQILGMKNIYCSKRN